MIVRRRPVPLGAPSYGGVERRSIPAGLPAGLDPHMHDALTDLHTYVLALDAERQRLADGATEISAELEALRATVVALRACADPGGNRL